MVYSQDIRVLESIIHQRFDVFNLKKEIAERNLPISKNLLKDQLSESLRCGIEANLLRNRTESTFRDLIRMRDLEIKSLNRHKKKPLKAKMDSRNMKGTSGTKAQMISKLTSQFEKEKQEFRKNIQQQQPSHSQQQQRAAIPTMTASSSASYPQHTLKQSSPSSLNVVDLTSSPTKKPPGNILPMKRPSEANSSNNAATYPRDNSTYRPPGSQFNYAQGKGTNTMSNFTRNNTYQQGFSRNTNFNRNSSWNNNYQRKHQNNYSTPQKYGQNRYQQRQSSQSSPLETRKPPPITEEQRKQIDDFSLRGEYPLSAEQKKVLEVAEKPSLTSNSNGSIVRVTAAAGAGKTTTLLKLAEYASTYLNHKEITYVTYNRTAAADGERRLAEHLSSSKTTLNACTLHSCAHKCLAADEHEKEDDNFESRMIDDNKLEEEIERICRREIEDFLQDCYATIRTKDKFKNKIGFFQARARKQVLFYLKSAFNMFCRSFWTLNFYQVGSKGKMYRDYYPAKLFHTTGDGPSWGFEQYQNRVSFYADTISNAWSKFSFKTFDLLMKRAQLKKLKIPGSLLLVDEAQDLDACMTDWLAVQSTQYGKHVFFVGDAAQTIYSFRGAKSKHMMSVKNVIDCTLTRSWRFGPSIAKVANLVLFAKENSPQTTGSGGNNWRPYRLYGKENCDGIVTVGGDSLLEDLKNEKVTLIGRTNAHLLVKALHLFGFKFDDPKEEGDEKESKSSLDNEHDATNHVSDKGRLSDICSIEPSQFPKIHINGKGDSSGIKKWKQVTKQIVDLFELFKFSPEPIQLNPRQFPEFANEDSMNWASFVADVENRELSRYSASISVINTFKNKTEVALQLFEEYVINANHSEENANIIISTSHSAKGMEWDNVYVCEDFLNMNTLKKEYLDQKEAMCFNFKSWGDDVNLLYVAVTRAKRKLFIPQSVHQFLTHCDIMTKGMSEKEVPDDCRLLFGFGCGRENSLNTEDAKLVYNTIILKLRTEIGAKSNQNLLDIFVSDNRVKEEKVPTSSSDSKVCTTTTIDQASSKEVAAVSETP